jgi:hypothetical protein
MCIRVPGDQYFEPGVAGHRSSWDSGIPRAAYGHYLVRFAASQSDQAPFQRPYRRFGLYLAEGLNLGVGADTSYLTPAPNLINDVYNRNKTSRFPDSAGRSFW